MEILGIGPMELLLILIVALMVFGPDKLPQIGAKLGRGMRDMRRATRAISDEINNTRAAVEGPVRELAEPFQDVAEAAKGASSVAAAARNPGQTLRDSVMRELNTAVKPDLPGEAAAEEENKIAPPSISGQGQDDAAIAKPSLTTPPEPNQQTQPVAPETASTASEEGTLAPNGSEPTEPDPDDHRTANTVDPLTPHSSEQ